ncbi:MAG: HNH endonuclease [Thermotogota bacterium]|nr:HNH endonuclease [Thermotogota bacterium]
MKVRFLRDKEGKTDRNYVIAEDGSYIRNRGTGEKLDNIYVIKDYRVITIKINGNYYHHIKISILQWLAWKGIIPKRYVIHHKDENKLNDHIDNLDCLLKSEHSKFHNTGKKNPMYGTHYFSGEKNPMYGRRGRDAPMYGRRDRDAPMYGRIGEKSPLAKLTSLQVKEIRRLSYIYHWRQKDIVEKFNVSRGCINCILQGYSWNPDHLTKQQLVQQIKEINN